MEVGLEGQEVVNVRGWLQGLVVRVLLLLAEPPSLLCGIPPRTDP